MYRSKGQRPTDTDKIRFGIIGTNSISDWFIMGAAMDSRFEPAAICSRSESRAAEFALRHRIPHRFTSVEDMAGSDAVDAVYIATPNALHACQSIVCMKHGKHVLCEKPFASNAHEAEAMAAASHKYGVTLMEAMKTTLTPNFRYVINNLGKLGKIRRYFASYCQYSSRYDTLKEGIVLNAFNPELSNGATMDIGTYTIYPMVVLFGMPDAIIANGMKLHTGVDGQGAAIFRYDGMEAEVIYSKISDSHLPAEIQGEDGTFSIMDIHDMRAINFYSRRRNASANYSQREYLDEYYYEAAEFIDTIKSGNTESSINSHRNSVTTMRILDEIRSQIGVSYPADAFPPTCLSRLRKNF